MKLHVFISCEYTFFFLFLLFFSHGAAQGNNVLRMYYNYLICRPCNDSGTCQPLFIFNYNLFLNFHGLGHFLLLYSQGFNQTWPRGSKTFFKLSSAEHEISTAHKYQITQNILKLKV